MALPASIQEVSLSKIRNKISSIEADDDVVSRALGLRPVTESEPLKPVAPADDLKISEPSKKEPSTGPIKDSKKAIEKKAVEKKAAEKKSPADRKSTPAYVEKTPVIEKTPAIATRSRHDMTVNEESRSLLWIAMGLGLAWLLGSILATIFLFGVDKFGSYSAGQWGGLAFFILFPLMLIAVIYAAFKKMSSITQQASRLEVAANELMRVDETVVRRATEMSGVVKREIDTLNSGIDTALTRASTLQSVLESETKKLGETSLDVEDKTQRITERLTTEREALFNISNAFDEQMKSLSQSLDSHSENLAMSTKTAEQKIQEARLSVENTASKINQTSDLIRNNTMEAATTLTGNQDEILKLSDQLRQRAEELDTIYQKHGQDLNAMIAQLRNEQEVLSQSLEERLSKMRDVALSAQVSAERLTEASEAGRQTVMSLSEAAQLSESSIKTRFAEMEEVVKFSNQRAESISEKAARRVQDSLSQTRKEIARIEMDMLNLQEKLSSVSDGTASKLSINEMDNASEEPPVQDEELAAEIPPKKKKGALNFVPLDVDDDPQTQDFFSMETPSETSSLSGGLRPAPKQEESFLVEPKPVQDSLDGHDMDQGALDLTIENGLMKPATNIPAEPESIVSNETSIRRAAGQENVSRSWWKNLFGRTEDGEPNTMVKPIAAVTAATAALAVPATAALGNQQANDTFLRVLSSQGLSPNAIVDNGCIVEAVQNRMFKGTKQMSIGVADRLGEPIRLFSGLLENDPNMKDQAVDFAVAFHHSLTPIAGDQEALMNRFGTENGRLFLMCDAALNG